MDIRGQEKNFRRKKIAEGQLRNGVRKRIIPCLDVKDGRVVKGVNFISLVDAGDPVLCAQIYDKQLADELVFLDINASHENRNIILDIVQQVAETCMMPFTVGGGVSDVADFRKLLLAGADKVSVNSSAIKNPQLITDAANNFGSQCVVVAIDVKKNQSGWEVFSHGGRKSCGIDALEWAQQVSSLGAGELLVTSMDADGTKDGYDVALYQAISQKVNIPIIASGGAGELRHFAEVLQDDAADAVLAASIFHFGKFSIAEVKHYLAEKNIPTR